MLVQIVLQKHPLAHVVPFKTSYMSMRVVQILPAEHLHEAQRVTGDDDAQEDKAPQRCRVRRSESSMQQLLSSATACKRLCMCFP